MKRRASSSAQPRCFPQSHSEQNAQLFNSGSMYRLDTCQVLIMHLAPTTENAEIKEGCGSLFATDGRKAC